METAIRWFDDDKYTEIYESAVRSLIIDYWKQRIEVEGYPFQKSFRWDRSITMTKIISVTIATLST
jgi:hypothetical protein